MVVISKDILPENAQEALALCQSVCEKNDVTLLLEDVNDCWNFRCDLNQITAEIIQDLPHVENQLTDHEVYVVWLAFRFQQGFLTQDDVLLSIEQRINFLLDRGER